MAIPISCFDDFALHEGEELGTSDKLTITQDMIDKFAGATLDHQWIHTDPERAKKEGGFGSTIAHGYLTLSIVPHLWDQIVHVTNLKMMINYGVEKFRFGQAVKVDDTVILHAKLEKIVNLRGIVKAEVGAKLEIVGEKKPAYTGTLVFLYHFNS